MKYLFIIMFFITISFSQKVPLIKLPIYGVQANHTFINGEDETFVIERHINEKCYSVPIDEEHLWGGEFANKKVPNECKKTFVTSKGTIQPMHLVKGVETIGELEVMEFIKEKSSKDPKNYLLIDSRTNGWYEQNTIPSAVNVPYTDLDYDEMFEEYYYKALKTLGIKINKDKSYDFSNVKEIIMFCNGSWCAQSPRAIKHLVEIGYPAEKIKWYRGGMTAWLSVGLTTTREIEDTDW